MQIDEGGVSRLQSLLEENRALAESVAEAFDAASKAIQGYVAAAREQFPSASDLSGEGLSPLGLSSSGSVSLDLSEARAQIEALRKDLRSPLRLTGDASGVVSAARTAYANIRSLFSSPVSIRAVVSQVGSDIASGLPKMSSGGRFSRPTGVQVAEDGDPEYIIPVRKEGKALPLLRQLLSELSPAAREQLTGGGGLPALPGLSASAAGVSVTQNNSTVSAPVNIHVTAAGTDPEAVGESIYNTAERYLMRTLESSVPG